ncbi:hypothetical protein ARMGADRAFT_1040105 [Armillaria gallica]|uniref:Uncharacterized protein n=1 Tax=Armillaria gallica TaxID=47427 RepID=A0A2H3CUE6_ARMGA|nr:hypothetical protein ARMGADRAFT_1040105 [Armillaria gallica]
MFGHMRDLFLRCVPDSLKIENSITFPDHSTSLLSHNKSWRYLQEIRTNDRASKRIDQGTSTRKLNLCKRIRTQLNARTQGSNAEFSWPQQNSVRTTGNGLRTFLRRITKKTNTLKRASVAIKLTGLRQQVHVKSDTRIRKPTSREQLDMQTEKKTGREGQEVSPSVEINALGDDADDDVPPTAAYRHAVAIENRRKANEEDRRCSSRRRNGRWDEWEPWWWKRMRRRLRPSGLEPTIEEHASVMRAYRRSNVQVPPFLPTACPSQYLRPEIPPLPVEDMFADTADTVLLNLTTLESPPHLIILLATSHRHPLIDPSITISTPICAGFSPTTTLKSLPPFVRRLRFMFKSVGKRTKEKTLRSAVVVCPAIEELEIEEEGGEECWCSIVPHLKSLRVLVMCKPGTAQIKAAKEELDERFPLPKRARTRSTSSAISHSGHSMVVSERARATHLANACPALQHVVFLYAVRWHRPSSSPPLS